MRRTAVAVHNMFKAQMLRQPAFRQLQSVVEQPKLLTSVCKQSCIAHQSPGLTWSAAAAGRGRSVRAKADSAAANSRPAAAATAAADVGTELDALYVESPKRSTAAAADTGPAPGAAAATATLAGAPEDILGALYNAEDAAAVATPAAAGDGDLLESLYAADDLAAAISGPRRPAAAVAAAVAAAAVNEDQQQPSSPTSSAGGSSTRAPPTYVRKPEIPDDLDVFKNAVLLVDKPKTWTSFDACNAIKKAMQKLGVKKVGHAGTLDPAATGLLIICTGSGTKSIESFMAAHKEYSGTLKLGEGTPTLDAEGEVNESLPWEHITDEQITQAAQKLTGDIEQVPPMFSALHHNGQRLHELARAGVTVERQARPVTITRFDVHRDPHDKQLVHFYVGCSKGTYIRTLGHDLATSLGTTGHLVALRREAIGDARVDDAWDVETLMDKLFAAIRERRPEAFNREAGNQGNKQKRGRGGGRRNRKEQHQEQLQEQQQEQQ